VTFNSFSFLLLLPLLVALFWALPVRARRPYMLGLSLVLYACWQVDYVVIPLLIAGAVYLGVRRVLADPGRKALWTWCGIAFVLAVLIWFKYRAFIFANLDALIPALHLPTSAGFQPVGVSFAAFTAIGLLIDARQRRVTSLSFADSVLFLTFFPNAASGPIVRARELMNQLKFAQAWEARFLVQGLDRLVWGLVQKNMLANSLQGLIKDGFFPQSAATNSSLDNWFLALGYGLQIYFDFAGYTNQALGVAQLFGVRLPENFRYPYHAENPSDFWQRWHMSLSRWIRDYLFFPINARFKGAMASLYLSLLGIMGLVGLWHGAGWGFIVWGLMHGTYLLLYRAWEDLQQKRFPALGKARFVRWAWRLFTLAAVLAAWVPFRAATLGQAGTMLRSMFLRPTFGASYSVNLYLIVLAFAAGALVEPWLMGRLARWEKKVVEIGYSRWNLFLVRPLAYALGLLLFMIFDDGVSKFIYFQF